MNVINPMRLEMTLDDRLTQESGWVYMTGMQALTRLPIQQAKRDKASGLNTGGFISGYRGSPVGTYDMSLWQAETELKKHNIVFQPGVNEDLAATATWGAQQVGLFPGAKVDGVFSIWYGKAPGLDRSMDPLRHANLAGTNKNGGTLLLVGDDHGAKSSTLACFSDGNFVSLGAPLLSPANAQQVLDFGLHGIAMSRYSSTLVGLKLVTDVVEGGGSVYVAPDSPGMIMPESNVQHPGIKPFVPILEQERLLWDVKLELALEYARANQLNRISGKSEARIGIISSGKAWQDLEQALASMGYKDGMLNGTPIKLLQVGMIWPLDHVIIEEFAESLDIALIVEEKRPIIEDQLRNTLYGKKQQPRIIGKKFDGNFFDHTGVKTAFPAFGEIAPDLVESVIRQVFGELNLELHGAPVSPGINLIATLATEDTIRAPSFCAGCPHGRSTQVVDGSRALAGIGCHTMAVFRDPMKTNSICHMGGEGVGWVGQFNFTNEKHVFANMGDGTYFHSGLLAIRAAIASGANITYKILFNGFVSMTGGQPHDGELSPTTLINQLKAEGVKLIALVTDDTDKYKGQRLGDGVTLYEREQMESVQKQLREISGVTALVYEQPCAAERRRLRKRGKWSDPDTRVFINPEVCEGCGDCSTVSGCMAIEPLETKLGRKRQINQSSCNKDYSCLEGFCPSLITVSGAQISKQSGTSNDIDVSALPMPKLEGFEGSWSILVSGIGGTGVVTVGQMLSVAAHAAGYYSSNLDITGLAQKYGAVHSHVKFSTNPDDRRATRIARQEADALIGCDLVVASGSETLGKLKAESAVGVSDVTIVPTAEFSMNPDWNIEKDPLENRIQSVLAARFSAIPAQNISERLMGDSVYANMILVGACWQLGGIPLPLQAIHKAIELNGVKIDDNKKAFDLGRLAAHDLTQIENRLNQNATVTTTEYEDWTFDQIVEDRQAELVDYQNEAYAMKYRDQMDLIAASSLPDAAKIAIAGNLYKLMAVKDEWEVARLYSKPAFRDMLEQNFEGKLQLQFHFGAWPFSRKSEGGRPGKIAVGGWVLSVFKLMNRFSGLRGSILDPFKNSKEQVLARKLLNNYQKDIEWTLEHSNNEISDTVVELLSLPEQIRGYGHIRENHAEAVEQKRAKLKAV